MLHLVPTLTASYLPGGNASVFDGYTLNLTGCTAGSDKDGERFLLSSVILRSANADASPRTGVNCGAVSNATSGRIINPVMSARISTRKSHNIQYGKVEIRAKIPRGYVQFRGETNRSGADTITIVQRLAVACPVDASRQ
jgi:hypothetical protein